MFKPALFLKRKNSEKKRADITSDHPLCYEVIEADAMLAVPFYNKNLTNAKKSLDVFHYDRFFVLTGLWRGTKQ